MYQLAEARLLRLGIQKKPCRKSVVRKLAKQHASIAWTPERHGAHLGAAGGDNIDYTIPAPARGIDMLLAKYRGEPYESEVKFIAPQETRVPVLARPLNEAQIVFVTDGGLVPKGNPDDMRPVNSDKFCIYSFYGADSLKAECYEVSHQGYDNHFVQEDPNRLVPLDAARQAVREKRIAKVFDFFYSTAGVMVSVENGQSFGRKIAASIRESGADLVILTSTCGTSTRCGAHIACEIEREGIPVVHVTNLSHISEWVGTSRILRGNNVSHVFGNPELPPEQEREYRQKLFYRALELAQQVPENGCLIVQ